MQCESHPADAADAAADAGSAASVGLPKESGFCLRLSESVSAVMGADRKMSLCVDALPFAGWRRIGKNRCAQARDRGCLYGAWISFLPRRAFLELAAVLSGGKAAGALDGSAGHCEFGRLPAGETQIPGGKCLADSGGRRPYAFV